MAGVTRRRIGTALMVLGGIMSAAFAAAIIFTVLMSSNAAPKASPNGVEPETMGGLENPVDWNYWKSVNPDVVGWIRIPETGIDLPIVQAHADWPQYYLSHDVYGNWNIWGCPYVDSGCEQGLDSRNVVIFSHNMATGDPMFGELAQYADEGFAFGHKTVYIYTPDEVRVCDVYGADNIGGWEPVKRVKFDSVKDYQSYRHERLSACDVVVGHLDETGTDRMYTLVTCTYTWVSANERTVVYAFEESVNTKESAAPGILDAKDESAVTLRAEE